MFRISFAQELPSDRLIVSCTNQSFQLIILRFLECSVCSSTSFIGPNLYLPKYMLIHTSVALVECLEAISL